MTGTRCFLRKLVEVSSVRCSQFSSYAERCFLLKLGTVFSVRWAQFSSCLERCFLLKFGSVFSVRWAQMVGEQCNGSIKGSTEEKVIRK